MLRALCVSELMMFIKHNSSHSLTHSTWWPRNASIKFAPSNRECSGRWQWSDCESQTRAVIYDRMANPNWTPFLGSQDSAGSTFTHLQTSCALLRTKMSTSGGTEIHSLTLDHSGQIWKPWHTHSSFSWSNFQVIALKLTSKARENCPGYYGKHRKYSFPWAKSVLQSAKYFEKQS